MYTYFKKIDNKYSWFFIYNFLSMKKDSMPKVSIKLEHNEMREREKIKRVMWTLSGH